MSRQAIVRITDFCDGARPRLLMHRHLDRPPGL